MLVCMYVDGRLFGCLRLSVGILRMTAYPYKNASASLFFRPARRQVRLLVPSARPSEYQSVFHRLTSAIHPSIYKGLGNICQLQRLLRTVTSIKPPSAPYPSSSILSTVHRKRRENPSLLPPPSPASICVFEFEETKLDPIRSIIQ